MSKSRDRITYIVTGAIIAALYVDLTFLSNIFNLAYGQIQFRVSEVLTIRREGAERRKNAEIELGKMDEELRTKLLAIE